MEEYVDGYQEKTTPNSPAQTAKSSEISLPKPIVAPKETLSLALKRVIDITGATIGLFLFSPIILLAAILIKFDSKGPLIFKQIRVGLNGRKFTFYKFRSMINDAEAQRQGLLGFNEVTGPLFKIKKDPRITKVGYWLRKASLDELPQFINVLKGEMSLVGPRPPIPEEVEEYDARVRQRFLVTPGLTGLWQINGRSDIPFDKMIELDLAYIENWSLWLDLKILVKTIPVILSRKGAY